MAKIKLRIEILDSDIEWILEEGKVDALVKFGEFANS